MYNLVDLKFSILSKLGSFWYRTVEDDASYTVHKMTHVASLFDTDCNFGKLVSTSLGTRAQSCRDFIIRFGDNDIDSTSFILNVDKNLLVTSINMPDGSVACRNSNFSSDYGYIKFLKDPRSLFPKLRIHVRSAVKRHRNILCWPLGVLDIYGDVSFIVDYYRCNQSPFLFKLATAQAAGLQVISKDCIVQAVIDHTVGYSYLVSTGERYDAWYPHTALSVGDSLKQGLIISGNLFDMILPQDPDSSLLDLTGIMLGNSCPVGGVFVQNDVTVLYDENNDFRPLYGTDPQIILKYHSYLEHVSPPKKEDGLLSTGNALEHFRNTVAARRCIIVVLPQGDMSQYTEEERQVVFDIRKKAISFIKDNAPIGAVVVYGLKDNDS